MNMKRCPNCGFGSQHCSCVPIAQVKPPLGVMPRNLWEEKRALELARAIHEYVSAVTPCGKITEWIDELRELVDKG